MITKKKVGVLLINLGTPDSLEIKDLKKFLKEFLSDPRVLTIPSFFRWLLLRLIILPFRPKKIQQNYKKIWTKDGSPLAFYAKKITSEIQDILGKEYIVRYAMRYRNPSIEKELNYLIRSGLTDIIIVPLFPQYAMATTGSIYAEVFEVLKKRCHIPAIRFVGDYFRDDFFISAQAELARPYLQDGYDHVVFTFHGIPKDHLTKYSDSITNYCYAKKNCCLEINLKNQFCYKAQCHATAKALAEKLKIEKTKYTVAFQSRFGKAEWIQPYTTNIVAKLGRKKSNKIVLMCPAFIADCVETIDEINNEERENFLAKGGKQFETVPCVNDHPIWVEGLAKKIVETTETR